MRMFELWLLLFELSEHAARSALHRAVTRKARWNILFILRLIKCAVIEITLLGLLRITIRLKNAVACGAAKPQRSPPNFDPDVGSAAAASVTPFSLHQRLQGK